jgi:metallo-beta-lactamase family protein
MAREDDPFGFSGLEYVRDVEKSISLNDDPRPAIIISASGMCENGRILHHLKNNIEDERNTILIVGFMARHTLGRRMAEKEKEVRIFNRLYQLKAEVVIMDSFSAHADRGDILNYLTEAAKGVKGVFFVHGEEDQALAIAELVKEKLGLKTFVPEPGEAVEL